ncbi:hypothetical protein [Taibaiella koreensis]|uniref:hypothetical protein n=1 Tax=Taibaiella koreensis TaxID=1268548 RepID=UPI000E59FE94|nr:hypothetical protein [Taibaiella koreensis]
MAHWRRSLIGILILVFPAAACAQLELYSKCNTDRSIEPVINYYGSRKINKQFAVTFFGLVRQKWGQALIGATYIPSPNINLSVSAGIETGQTRLRYSASLWLKRGENTLLLLGELGKGYQNYLYKVNVFHRFSDKLSLGIMDWRYHGLGPNFRYTIAGIASTLWVMPAYDHEQKVARCMVGWSLSM